MMEHYIPTLSKINRIFIAVSTLLFILSSFFDLTPYLGLDLNGILSGLLYKLVTFPFVEKNFTAHLFNCLLLWFLGSEIENKLGQKNYLKFVLISLSCSAIFFLIFTFNNPNLMLYGLNGLCFCLLMAYGTIFGDRILSFMMIFPMKARYFCLLLMLVEIYMGIFSPLASLAWGNLFSLIGGMLFLKIKYNIHFGINFPQKFKRNTRPKLYIVENDPKKPKYWQ